MLTPVVATSTLHLCCRHQTYSGCYYQAKLNSYSSSNVVQTLLKKVYLLLTCVHTAHTRTSISHYIEKVIFYVRDSTALYRFCCIICSVHLLHDMQIWLHARMMSIHVYAYLMRELCKRHFFRTRQLLLC